jgi:isocitrate/isopropylmalate dehydrogenase
VSRALSPTEETVVRRPAGIGPEISQSVKDIYTKAKVPIVWEEVDVTPSIVDGVSTIPKDSLDSIRRNTVALKGAHGSLLNASVG